MSAVLVAGHLCLDLIPDLKPGFEFQPGKLLEVGDLTFSTGGSVSNTGLALHRLGVSVSLAGKVSDDRFGAIVRERLESFGAGLADHLIVEPGKTTSYSMVLSNPGHDRMFLHYPGTNGTFRDNDLNDGFLLDGKIFHFGYPPLMREIYKQGGAELILLFRRAKQFGTVTSLDMSLPDPETESGKADWKRLLANVLPLLDVFMPSAEELTFMLDRGRFDRLKGPSFLDGLDRRRLSDLAGQAIEMGADVVGLKVGHRGLFLKTSGRPKTALSKLGIDDSQWLDRELWHPTFTVDVKGTTGTGDATIAGFLMGLLGGDSPERALERACAVGACCCEAPDAVSGIKPWREIQARLDAGWAKTDQ